ncbi:hypothetical protein D3C75_731650 [compost metagenome]
MIQTTAQNRLVREIALLKKLGNPAAKRWIARCRVGQGVHFFRKSIEIMLRFVLCIYRNQLFGTVPVCRENNDASGRPQILTKALQETGVFVILEREDRRAMRDKKCR